MKKGQFTAEEYFRQYFITERFASFKHYFFNNLKRKKILLSNDGGSGSKVSYNVNHHK